MKIKLLIGLGNPGLQYSKTRHNVGFMFIDYLVDKLNLSYDNNMKYGSFAIWNKSSNTKVLIGKSNTYMNLSGKFVSEVARFYKIDPSDIIIVYDDIDLPLGKWRMKTIGSSGGHNGIKSIIEHLSTQEFCKYKIGIDRPPTGYKVPDYVLGKFTNDQQQQINDQIINIYNEIMRGI